MNTGTSGNYYMASVLRYSPQPPSDSNLFIPGQPGETTLLLRSRHVPIHHTCRKWIHCWAQVNLSHDRHRSLANLITF